MRQHRHDPMLMDADLSALKLTSAPYHSLLSLLAFVLISLATIGLPITSHAESSSLSDLLGDKISNHEQPTFLNKEDAFRSQVRWENGDIVIDWEIADEYYLYQDKFKFELLNPSDGTILGAPIYSHDGKLKHDEIFGEVNVYYHDINIRLPLTTDQSQVTFKLRYQGCAEAGLCYPPSSIETILTPGSGMATLGSPKTQNNATPQQPPATSKPAAASASNNAPDNTETVDGSDANSIANFLNQSGFLTIIALCFVLGLGLTFTPCVLPMMPILSSVILGQQGKLSTTKGFVLSLSYVVGMALAFAIAGLLVGLSGARIQLYMQMPAVLVTFSIIFVILSFAMFGFYELQLPSSLRDRLSSANDNIKGGNLFGVFLMGMLSALVVSPCVSAPLAGILLYIGTEGNPTLGAFALFSLGMGMGAPLIALATSGANLLPRAGAWMNSVKYLFGVMLLGVAVWLVRTVLPGELVMLLWAALLIIPAIYMGAFDVLDAAASGWRKFWKGVALMMLCSGVTLIIGAALGNTNPLKPLGNLTGVQSAHAGQAARPKNLGLKFDRVTTPMQLEAALEEAKLMQEPVMLDYYADWCIACVEMEHYVFSQAQVAEQLDGFTTIQIDITETGPAANALLDRYNLPGPPSILFFNKQGEQLNEASILGEMKLEKFMNHVDKKVLPNI